MGIELAKGTCGKCGSQGPIIGKREKALCPKCYNNKLRQPKEGSVPKEKKIYIIPKKSEKQKKIDVQYAKQRGPFLEKNKYCQMRFEGCTYYATQVQHLRGRGIKFMLNEEEWMACCDNCHKHEVSHTNEAKAAGVIRSRLGKDFIR